MNDLAHQPEVLLHLIGGSAQTLHKIKIQHICRVQANAVHIKLLHPEPDRITDVILNLRISLVQLDQQIVSAPVFIRKSIVVLIIPAEIYIAVPVPICRALTVLLQIPEREEISPGMVEYTVKNNPDSGLMAP